jgi:hypothetical protein
MLTLVSGARGKQTVCAMRNFSIATDLSSLENHLAKTMFLNPLKTES